MANNSSANIGFEKQIWDAACELWGHIPAADYRKVIIGLIFLRYIGNAFENQYNKLVADGDGFEDDPDAYEAENIFFVPEAARWSKIAAAAHKPEIGTVIDNAMRAIEEDNKKLKNVLPKNFASPDLDKRVLGNVVDLFTNMNMDDTEGERARETRTFVEKLKLRVTVPVEFADERLTTMEAAEILDESGIKRSEQKRVIDQVAAQLILEQYLRG